MPAKNGDTIGDQIRRINLPGGLEPAGAVEEATSSFAATRIRIATVATISNAGRGEEMSVSSAEGWWFAQQR